MQINVAKVNKRKFDEKKFSSAPEFLRDGWFRVAGKIRGGKVFTTQPKTNFYSRKVRFSQQYTKRVLQTFANSQTHWRFWRTRRCLGQCRVIAERCPGQH